MGIVDRLLDRHAQYGPRSLEVRAADIITRLKGYAVHGKRSDGEACSAAWVKGADCDCGLSALLEEIDHD